MPLWRFIPVAGEDDSHWQDRRIWEGVVVRAPSAAMARVFAEEAEEQRVRGNVGNETKSYRGGFGDPNLYWVERLSADTAESYDSARGADGIVAKGTPRQPTLSVYSGANAGNEREVI